ncbi:MAG: hypothetical protein ABSG66_08025 [Stellaceae bacterium]|jgi:hypothetical protein
MIRILTALRDGGVGVAALLAAGITAPAALAQSSPAPIGFWSTGSGNETLYIGANGTCKFEGPGTLVLGKCGWKASSGGGILTIMNTNQFKPAPIYENIVWVNRTTIRVWGDVFYRKN